MTRSVTALAALSLVLLHSVSVHAWLEVTESRVESHGLAVVAPSGDEAASAQEPVLPGSTHQTRGLLEMIGHSASAAARDERYRRTSIAHGVAGLGAYAVRGIGHPRSPAVFGAGSFDRFFRDAFRSRSHDGNFLDNTAGALAVPLLGTGLMLVSGSLFDSREAHVDAVVR